MTVRRSLAVLGMTLAAGTWLIGTTPASAATPISGCSEGVYYVLPGATYTVSFASCPGTTTHYYNSAVPGPDPVDQVSYDVSVTPGSYGNTWVESPSPAPALDIAWMNETDQMFYVCGEDWTIGAGGDPGPGTWTDFMNEAPATYLCATPSGAQTDAPAPAVQSVPAPASGTCASFEDASLNWGGVGSGGWASSWEQWANDGRGGAVCTRTLTYDTRRGRWATA